MKRALNWLFPHPLLTLILTIVWITLQNDISAGMTVFGIILGVIIPRITAVWWPDRPSGIRAGKFVVYTLIVVWDIIMANIQVAWIILTKSNANMRPAWVEIPLDLKRPEAIT
ncbi:MAG: Na+/H+ antiporter subunit E, partial [Pseudomonadota bacterium]